MSTEIVLNDPSKPIVMSSKDIADLTKKQHKHVLADCRKMFSELDLTAAEFSATVPYTAANNSTRHREVYNLDHDLMMTLVTGYSTKLRHAVVSRWRQLEIDVKKLEMQQITEQRDRAIADRGRISSAREATVMSKLANLSAFDEVDAQRVSQLAAAEARELQCPEKEIADTLRTMLGVKRLPKRPDLPKPEPGEHVPRAVNQALIDLGYQELDNRITEERVKGKLVAYDHRYKPLHFSQATMQATYAGAIMTIIAGGSSRYNFRVAVSWKWSRSVIKPLFEYMQGLIREKQNARRASTPGE